jgi:hypothetical protein
VAIKVKLLNESEEVLARRLRIVHGKGSLETPAYMVNPSDIDGDLVAEENLDGVVELDLRLTVESLEKMNVIEEAERKFGYRATGSIRRIPEGQLIISVPLIEGRKEVQVDPARARVHASYVAELTYTPHG